MSEIRIIVKKIKWKSIEAELERLCALLYPARKVAVDRLNNMKAKVASVATGLLLQDIVREELGIEPKDLIVGKGEQGKPYIEGYPNFHFNISHSSDMVAIAYGISPVGIDIEHIRCRESDLKVAKRCFTPEEYTFITGEAFCKDSEGISHSVEERFFMVWTMKEAYLKYKGTGISVPMNSFLVKPYQGVVDGESLKCQPFVIDDYVYSVCVNEDVDVSLNFI